MPDRVASSLTKGGVTLTSYRLIHQRLGIGRAAVRGSICCLSYAFDSRVRSLGTVKPKFLLDHSVNHCFAFYHIVYKIVTLTST